MRAFYVLTLTCAWACLVSAQYPLWTKLNGASTSDSQGSSVAVSAKSGAILVAGTTRGDLDGQDNHGYIDAFVSKYDASGNKAWTRLIGGTSSESANMIRLDSSDNAYVVGGSRSSAGIDDASYRAGNRGAYMMKISSTGTTAWAQLFGNSSSDEATALEVTKSGLIHVTGTWRSPATSSSGSFLYSFNNRGKMLGGVQVSKRDARAIAVSALTGIIYVGGGGSVNSAPSFLASFSNNNMDWSRAFTSSDAVTGLAAVPASDDVYVAGYLTGNPVVITLRRVSNTQEVVWSRTYTTAATNEYASSIAVDAATGEIYLIGKASAVGSSLHQVLTYKLSANGDIIQRMVFGDAAADSYGNDISGATVTTTRTFRLALTGYTNGNLNGASYAYNGSDASFVISAQGVMPTPAPTRAPTPSPTVRPTRAPTPAPSVNCQTCLCRTDSSNSCATRLTDGGCPAGSSPDRNNCPSQATAHDLCPCSKSSKPCRSLTSNACVARVSNACPSGYTFCNVTTASAEEIDETPVDDSSSSDAGIGKIVIGIAVAACATVGGILIVWSKYREAIRRKLFTNSPSAQDLLTPSADPQVTTKRAASPLEIEE